MASPVSYGKPFVLKILITIDKTQSVVLKCQLLAIKLKKGIVSETIVIIDRFAAKLALSRSLFL